MGRVHVVSIGSRTMAILLDVSWGAVVWGVVVAFLAVHVEVDVLSQSSVLPSSWDIKTWLLLLVPSHITSPLPWPGFVPCKVSGFGRVPVSPSHLSEPW